MYYAPSGKSVHHCECAPCLHIGSHKLTKIVEPLALFMLFLHNKRELMQRLVARASQHVLEEVCGVGVDVGTF